VTVRTEGRQENKFSGKARCSFYEMFIGGKRKFWQMKKVN